MSAWALPATAAAMGALYVASGILLKEPVRLSKNGAIFLLALAGAFAIQILPVAPILFRRTAEMRSIHGVGQLWPATGDAEYTVRALCLVASCVLAGLFVLRMRQAGVTTSQILGGFLAVMVVEAAYGLVQTFAGFKDVPFYGPRPSPESASGTLVNRNNFAGLMAVGLVLASARAYGRFAWSRKRWEAGAGWALAAALFAVAIVLSKSRGGALAAMGGVFLLPFFYRGRASVAGAAALASLGAIAVLVANPAGLLERFGQLDPFELSADSRWTIAKTTAAAGLHQPLLGFGWGTHPRAYHPYQPPSLQGQIHHAHNEYVNVFFEAGVVGLAILLAGLGLWFVRAWRAQRTLSGPDRLPLTASMAAVAAIAIHSVVDFDLRIPSIGMVFAALAGIGAYASRDGSARRTWPAAAAAIAAAAAAAFLPLDPDRLRPMTALGLSPHDYRAAWRLARETGEPRRMEVAADLWPAHPDLQREAGLTFWDQGDRARAAKCLKRLFEQDPMAVAGVMEEAEDAGAEVLPALPGPHAVYAGVLARRGRWKEAQEAFDRGVAGEAENAGWFDYYAAQLEAVGQWGLEAVVRDRRLGMKSDAPAHGGSARAWLKLGAHDRALERATVAARIDPENGAWPALRGEIFAAKGDRLGAMEAYTEAARRAPGELEWRLRRGLIALEDKVYVAAADDLKEVLRSRPADRRAALGLARALAGQGQTSSARILLDDWLRKHPGDGEATGLRDSLPR